MTRWLSLSHAAEHFDITERTLLRLVKKGTIPPPHIRNGRPVWDVYALDRMMGRKFDHLLSNAEILSAAGDLPPIAAGIYFLVQDGRIVYVGQSRHVIKRLLSHMHTSRFDAWHWIPCAVDKLIQLEQDYIESLRPAWNKAGAA